MQHPKNRDKDLEPIIKLDTHISTAYEDVCVLNFGFLKEFLTVSCLQVKIKAKIVFQCNISNLANEENKTSFGRSQGLHIGISLI